MLSITEMKADYAKATLLGKIFLPVFYVLFWLMTPIFVVSIVATVIIKLALYGVDNYPDPKA